MLILTCFFFKWPLQVNSRVKITKLQVRCSLWCWWWMSLEVVRFNGDPIHIVNSDVIIITHEHLTLWTNAKVHLYTCPVLSWKHHCSVWYLPCTRCLFFFFSTLRAASNQKTTMTMGMMIKRELNGSWINDKDSINLIVMISDIVDSLPALSKPRPRSRSGCFFPCCCWLSRLHLYLTSDHPPATSPVSVCPSIRPSCRNLYLFSISRIYLIEDRPFALSHLYDLFFFFF